MNNPFRKPQVNPGVALSFANQEHLDRWMKEQMGNGASRLVQVSIEDADFLTIAALAEKLDRTMNTKITETGVTQNPDLAAAKAALMEFFTNRKGK